MDRVGGLVWLESRGAKVESTGVSTSRVECLEGCFPRDCRHLCGTCCFCYTAVAGAAGAAAATAATAAVCQTREASPLIAREPLRNWSSTAIIWIPLSRLHSSVHPCLLHFLYLRWPFQTERTWTGANTIDDSSLSLFSLYNPLI